MLYLKYFTLLNEFQEYDILTKYERRNIFVNNYPLKIFLDKQLVNIKFETITIFYGGNGSGKTTLLNIIAEKIGASRKSKLDNGKYFEFYVNACKFELYNDNISEIKVITSDDIFDYLLDARAYNSNINRRKEILSNEYINAKFNTNDSFENYEQLKNSVLSRKETMSKYIRTKLDTNNIQLSSNGESALMFWQKEIKENGIYILDEPENSLSAENQIKLKQFIEESTRFYNCQFIISTHSPFLLGLDNSIIYDLDEVPVILKKWTDLKNVRIYYDYFNNHKSDFE